MLGPQKQYELLIEQGEIQFDAAQEEAVGHLQSLFEQLKRRPVKNKGLITRWLGHSGPSSQIKGLYFWGGVGRGKTFLMDLFFESLDLEKKRRMHFHRFMRHIHQRLKILQGTTNPLNKIAIEFAEETQVLCFDEFFVSDITDAMILAGLLDEMFRRGIVLVATSNVEPCHLYENGLQRSKFLPAIALLEDFTKIINVDGGIDYRLRTLENAELYHSPLDPQANISLSESFAALCPEQGHPKQGSSGREVDNLVLEIEGREIIAYRGGDGVVWFEFKSLCEGPRSQNDYIEIAMIYQTVLISDIPQFTVDNEDSARRFIALVDEFYDHKVKLILSAAVGLSELYQGDRLVFEFQRTASRLQEMQSRAYLGQNHII